MSTEPNFPKFREEWTVGHSQGIHPGRFTREEAEEWIESDKRHDDRRQRQARNKQRLLRRLVGEWEEVPTRTVHPAGAADTHTTGAGA